MIGNRYATHQKFERQTKFTGTLLVSLALIIGLSSPSFAYKTQHGLIVQAMDDGTMYVPSQGLTKEKSFWCAVGEYVQHGLHKPGNTRIYRMSEPPRRAGQGVLFSLNGEGAASYSGVAVVGSGPAGSLSANMASALCPTITSHFY
jgi:hypothetical protein